MDGDEFQEIGGNYQLCKLNIIYRVKCNDNNVRTLCLKRYDFKYTFYSRLPKRLKLTIKKFAQGLTG